MTNIGRPRSYSLLKFFSLTYLVAWTCFLIVLARPGSEGSVSSLFLLYLGTFSPSLVALGLAAWDDGVQGIQELLSGLFKWQTATKWYLFAVGYMVAIKVAVALTYRVIAASWPRVGNEAWFVILFAILFSTPIQAGEEIGWRGYSLPRLAARFGFARAGVILGVIWAFWHLPLFYIAGLSNYGQSFPIFVLGGIALSIAMTWLFSRTGGSVLLVMLMHSAVNQTVGIVPSSVVTVSNPLGLGTSLVGWLTDLVLWIPAVYFLLRMPRVEIGQYPQRVGTRFA